MILRVKQYYYRGQNREVSTKLFTILGDQIYFEEKKSV